MAALEAESYLAELEDGGEEPEVGFKKSQTNNTVPQYSENPMVSKV
jgi:hypothetical protein